MTLIRHWTVDVELTARIRSRVAALGTDELDQGNVFRVAYPEIGSLTTVLADHSFASYLLSPRFSLVEQVRALEAAVVTIMSGSTIERLHDVAEQIASRGKAAVETAFSMRQDALNKRPATLDKSLIASSQRHRSCLPRHLSTVRMQVLPFQSEVAAPRYRVLAARRPLPELVEPTP